MKPQNKKTSFEHVAEIWDAKMGDTLARKPLSGKSGSVKVSVDAVVGMIPVFRGSRRRNGIEKSFPLSPFWGAGL